MPIVTLSGGFKILGETLPKRCPNCHTNQKLTICHKYVMTRWFAKIPLPLRNKYYAFCPNCHKLFSISHKQAQFVAQFKQ